MHFEGVFETGTPREQVYDLVVDPDRVARCLPDLQKLEVRSSEEFDAAVKAGVSLIRGDLLLRFRVAEKRPQDYIKLLAHGTGMGSAVDMTIEVEVSEGQAKKTSMSWSADAQVSGKIAALGQRVLESQAEKLIRRFFECLGQKLGP